MHEGGDMTDIHRTTPTAVTAQPPTFLGAER